MYDSQGYTEKPCLKTNKQTKKEKKRKEKKRKEKKRKEKKKTNKLSRTREMDQ